ncbi:MAG: M56 family metallopeptidase [Proteobacteria bacterium]|nr:M56 family metallopeptidase [Pseudomonadota bacterium]
MIAHLMIYGLEVASLLAAAAWAMERVAIWRSRPRRVGWAAAMVLSVAIPLVGVISAPPMGTSRIRPPSPSLLPTPAGPSAHAIVPARRSARPAMAPARVPAPQTQTAPPFNWEKGLAAGWLLTSCGLLVGFMCLATRLRLAARRWRREKVADQEVWITESLGPAVYGFIDPMIVLPQWLLRASHTELSVALAHERAHLAARDPALLLLGLIVIVMVPWNIPLWWQLRRLRFAIEVDCDARVLHRGLTPRDYGSALLAIGEHGNIAPLGAVALTEQPSQLRRRIQIMTSEPPKRGAGAMLGTVALAVACVAIAAATPAPASLRITSIAELPRKLPIEAVHNDPQVEALVRATYPHFFSGTGNTQPVLVTLFLNHDGSLYKSISEPIAPRPYVTTSFAAFDDAGIDFEHRGPDKRLRIQGASGLPVDVIAWYFQAPADPSRDVATVRAKAKARYSSLLDSTDTDKVVTALMTEAGEIDRAIVEPLNDRSPRSLATAQHFAELGLPADRLGLMGVTHLIKGHFNDDPDTRTLPIVYAWPRRANEHGSVFEVFNRTLPAAPGDDHTVDRLIAERYFPDLYTHPEEWPRADPWILLDPSGKVLTTGRRVVNSAADIQLNIQSLYPGIKTGRLQLVTFQGPRGQRPDLAFVWLAADSPVTDPAKADFSRQPDVLIYADVSNGEKTFYTEMLAMKFGSTGTTRCALRNPFGVVYLRVTLDKGDANAAAVRVRWQHMPLPAGEYIPDPAENSWSAQSAPIRAVYGGPSGTQLTDADGKKWDIVLHTDRMTHSAPRPATAPL